MRNPYIAPPAPLAWHQSVRLRRQQHRGQPLPSCFEAPPSG
uniref:Uncharacterized protein n=1 Tax=Arundo donax TaxID=35708 RepID=A0A0A9DRY3_ARUDO